MKILILLSVVSILISLSIGTLAKAEILFHYSFETRDLEDVSGKGNVAEIRGDAKQVGGRIGKALEFDGKDDYIFTAGEGFEKGVPHRIEGLRLVGLENETLLFEVAVVQKGEVQRVRRRGEQTDRAAVGEPAEFRLVVHDVGAVRAVELRFPEEGRGLPESHPDIVGHRLFKVDEQDEPKV